MVNDIDVQGLTKYLSAHVSGFEGPMMLDKYNGGQSNPTYKVMAQSGDYVLRRQPSGKLLKSAHAVDREYRVLRALANSAVPVAQGFHLCEDTSVIGSMFYLMEHIDADIFWTASLPEISDNTMRAAMYDSMNQTMAALHSLDIKACGLDDYGKAGNYYERQLARWSAQYRASELQKIDAMDQLINWLARHLPADDGRISLVHGDYRLDNIMFHRNKPDVAAVLDWELSTLGHPTADLAYQCMGLRMPQKMGSLDGLKGIDRASLGIPSEAEYVAKYCERMGIDKVDDWVFCLAFSFFRLAAIAQGVAKRASAGNASNSRAAEAGAFVKPLAFMALDVIANE